MKPRVLVDINVLLDVLAARRPHLADSQAMWSAVEAGQVEGFISAHSATTIYYLLRRLADHRAALRGIRLVVGVFNVVPVDGPLIEEALRSDLPDFEDAVQHQCAVRIKATSIITRDLRHFRRSSIPALTPRQFLGGMRT